MKKTHLYAIISLIVLTASMTQAQESNNNKKLWAKSVINQKAPELTVETWLSEIPNTKGKFVLIDFWATWCGPCIQVIPKLNDWHKKYQDKLVIIGLSDEKESTIKNFDKAQLSYFSATDTKASLKDKLEVQGIPHCILIDPQGIVRWEGFPTLTGHELTTQVIEQLLTKYATGKDSPTN